jgi:hypothetical protein
MKRRGDMKIRTQLKAGGRKLFNHNETLQTRTGLKAGRVNEMDSCHSLSRRIAMKTDPNAILKVRTSLKAGIQDSED